MKEDAWEQVRRRGRSFQKPQQRKSYHNVAATNTSFYVTNLPPGYDRDGKPKISQRTQKIPSSHAYNYGGERPNADHFSSVGNGRSFKDVVLNRQGLKPKLAIHLNSISSTTERLWGSKSLIGRAKNLSSLCSLRMAFSGANGVTTIRYLGGLAVLVQFPNIDGARSYLSNKDLWSEWFSTLDVWEGKMVPFERIAWVRILGVPPSLWDPHIFDQIGGKVGEVIHRSEASIDDCNLSLDCLGIIVSNGDPIQEQVTLNWNNNMVVCWVIEDPRPWVPEFVHSSDSLHSLEESIPRNLSVPRKEMDGLQPPQVGERAHGKQHAWENGDNNHSSFKFTSGTQEVKKGGKRNPKAVGSKGRAHHGSANMSGGGLIIGSSSGSRPKKRPRNVLEQIGPSEGGSEMLIGMPDLNDSPSFCMNPQQEEVGSGEQLTVVLNSIESMADKEDEIEEGQLIEGDNEVELQEEITSTILVAESVGIHLAGKFKEVREEIYGEETMFSDTSRIIIKSFWGNQRFEFMAVPSNGRSGGLLSIWDPTIFQKLSEISNQNYLLVSGSITGVPEVVHILNVYGPQHLNEKKLLWKELEELKSSNSGVWVMAGDFNEVRSMMDRRGSIFCSQGATIFNDFIHNAQLLEYNMGGQDFTYMKGNGESFSKLDRFLVCDSFINKWPNACVTALPRKWSDHCPIILCTSEIDFGPVPFGFFPRGSNFQGLMRLSRRHWVLAKGRVS
ncbi:hypothetical protein E3N88_30858 [Mikania micrantha]|uniref:Uncharacterized protein n=1 Tax=Mikania micrantha TaxID=192012 RepID=A0A5N6MQT6_9ASTR|nr:hypothetical protein E3N88_30858 [Mikania micrantha]